MKIKNMPESERPREKAMRLGVEALSDQEILAMFIRSGVKGKSALDIARDVLDQFENIYDLHHFSEETLLKIKGLSKLKVLELKCIAEIARRMAIPSKDYRFVFNSPQQIGKWLNNEIGFKKQEHFVVVFLNVKNQIIKFETVFIGTISMSIVHPREIFQLAIQVGASKIIVAHNHPSGDVSYSLADKQITKQLIEVGKICGIPVLDHLIVGKNNLFSFRENNVLHFE